MHSIDFSMGLACHSTLLTYTLQYSLSDIFALHHQLEKKKLNKITRRVFLPSSLLPPMLKANDV